MAYTPVFFVRACHFVYNEFVGDAFVVANGVPLVYNEFVGDAFVVANGAPFMLRG